MRKAVIVLVVLLLVLLVFGCTQQNKDISFCEKSSDCEYLSFTGGCYNPIVVDQILTDSNSTGIHIGEARTIYGKVNCTCELNKCTKNIQEFNLGKEWLNIIAQGMVDMSIPKNGFNSIVQCSYNGGVFYEAIHNWCCDAGTQVYDENGAIVCSVGVLTPIGSCVDYLANKTNCEKIWTTEIE